MLPERVNREHEVCVCMFAQLAQQRAAEARGADVSRVSRRVRVVETGVWALDGGACSGKPRDLCESCELSIVKIGLGTTEFFFFFLQVQVRMAENQEKGRATVWGSVQLTVYDREFYVRCFESG